MTLRALFFIVIIMEVVIPLTVSAQEESCEQKLTRATDEFELGHFTGIQSLLKPCLNSFSPEQKRSAYLLLVQVYLLLDDPIGAEESYLKLLQADPEFTPDPSQYPIEVVYMSRKFTASPILSLYLKIGPNITTVKVIQDIDAHGYPGLRESYSIKPGFLLGGGGEWHAFERISVTAELNYQLTAFSKKEFGLFGKDEIEITDRQSWLSLPVSVKYLYPLTKKYSIFGYAGYSASLLMSDRASINSFNKDQSPDDVNEVINKESEAQSVNMKSLRNSFNQSLHVGAGVRLKYKLNYFFADIRYSFGLSNVVNKNNLYQGSDVGYQIPYVDDFFRLNTLALSVGYVLPQYKPRELKRSRAKSLLRKIRKDKTDEE